VGAAARLIGLAIAAVAAIAAAGYFLLPLVVRGFVRGLTLTLGIAAVLLVSGQLSLALTVAVVALVILYLLHSAALLALPSRNPALFASATAGIPLGMQRASAIVSIIAMGGLIVLQALRDLKVLSSTSFMERLAGQSLTSLELVVFWSALGLLTFVLSRRGQAQASGELGS